MLLPEDMQPEPLDEPEPIEPITPEPPPVDPDPRRPETGSEDPDGSVGFLPGRDDESPTDVIESTISEWRNDIDTDRDGNISPEEQYVFLESLRDEFDDPSSIFPKAILELGHIDENVARDIIRTMVEDGELDIIEAWVLHGMQLSPAVREVIITEFIEQIKSGGIGEIHCEFFDHQRLPYNCVPTTVKMMLSRFGINTTEGCVTVIAILNGDLPNFLEGVDPLGVPPLLDRFGIDSRNIPNAIIEDLEVLREEGYPVALLVDADEVWYGPDDHEDSGRGVNHIVMFIGVDRSDPDNPMVILQDSGTEEGEYLRVPLDEFLDAWGDSDNFAIVPNDPAPPATCDITVAEMIETDRLANLRVD